MTYDFFRKLAIFSFVFGAAFFLFNTQALASAGFTASGASDSTFDGQYCPNGATVNTLPQYTNGNGKYLTFSITDDPAHYWVLSTIDIAPAGIGSGYTNWVYNTTGITGYSTNPDAATWSTLGSPSFTASTCGGGGGGGTTTSFSEFGLWGTITTSTEALIASSFPLWEIVLGILLALFLLFLIFYAFQRPLRRLFGR